jgi:biopolymer transport protein ExbD
VARRRYARLAMREAESVPEPVTEVNVIPVIDISLVLLVILFVTAPLLSYPALPVELPASTARPNQDLTIAVTLARDGRLSVRAAPSSWDALVPDLTREVSARPRSTVLLRADRAVSYRVLQRLISAAKASGARSIALGVEPAGR